MKFSFDAMVFCSVLLAVGALIGGTCSSHSRDDSRTKQERLRDSIIHYSNETKGYDSFKSCKTFCDELGGTVWIYKGGSAAGCSCAGKIDGGSL